MRATPVLTIAVFVALAASPSSLAQELLHPATAPATQPALPAFTRADFLFVPLHVHVLASDEDDLSATLSDDDVRRVVGKANGVWHQAGIHLVLQPILHEKAARVEDFKAALRDEPDALAPYKRLAPDDTRSTPGLHVYYIHRFRPNGVYLGERTCFVKDTARLREVAGGIDEPLPRVTSHELGHALGLPHRQDTFNLMASGTTATALNATEIRTARHAAMSLKGTLTAADAEKVGDALVKEALQALPER